MRDPDTPKRGHNLRPAYLYNYTGDNSVLVELRALARVKNEKASVVAKRAGVAPSTYRNHLIKGRVRSPKFDTVMSEILALGGQGFNAKTKKIT